MLARTTRMIASVGSSILGSGTFSIRTSPAAYMTVARMSASFSFWHPAKHASAPRDRPRCSRYWQGLPAVAGRAYPGSRGRQKRDPRVPDLQAREDHPGAGGPLLVRGEPAGFRGGGGGGGG